MVINKLNHISEIILSEFEMSSLILSKYKLVIIKLFKQLLIAVYLILILFSFPLTTLAVQNNELPTQKEGTTNKFTNYECGSTHLETHNTTNFYNYNSDFSIGTMAGAALGGLTSVWLVSISGKITDLSASGISSGLSTIGKILGGGMKLGLFLSAALPVIVIQGGLIFLNYLFTNLSHFSF